MLIGNRDFDLDNNTYICGILNMTPDSFSDGGKWNEVDAALRHVEDMINDGADIIDVGGESTRPGAEYVPGGLEMARIIPIIEEIHKRFDIPISVDTYKAEVAREAVKAGAQMLNDISGECYNGELEGIDLPTVITLNGRYDEEAKDQLITRAEKCGISPHNIILDPGIGFNKSYEDNLYILNNLDKYTKSGFPVYLGCSRKSVIRKTFDDIEMDSVDADKTKLLTGTLVTSTIAVMNRVSFIRVHDVRENYLAVKMAEAIRESSKG